MLCGEYSVLWGIPSIATTVNTFLDFQMEFLSESIMGAYSVLVHSNLWSTPKVVDSTIQTDDCLLEAVQVAANIFSLKGKWQLKVEGNMQVNFGVGSSSAIRLGVFNLIDQLCNQNQNISNTFRNSLALQRKAQPKASGYDLATQLVEGVVEYHQPENKFLESKDFDLEKHVQRLHSDALDSHTFFLIHPDGAPTSSTIASGMGWIAQGDVKKKWNSHQKKMHQKITNLHIDRPLTYSELFEAIENFRQFAKDAPIFPGNLFCEESFHELGESWTYKTTGAGGLDSLWVLMNPHSNSFKKDHGASLKSEICKAFAESGFELAPFKMLRSSNCNE